MTAILKLVRLDDFISDVDSIDLLAGGFSLATDGYAPAVAPLDAKSVHEVITLNLKGTSTDGLALMVQEIDAKIKQVQWWLKNPGVERYQVWLRVQMDEESNPRQAQLLNIEPAQKVNEFTKQETDDHTIVEYSIGIERTPFWEQPYPYITTTAQTGLNVIGGYAKLYETIHGDVPARLAKLSMAPESSAIHGDYYVAFKTARFGNPANFVPVWSLKDGHFYTDTTTTSDSSAYSGTRVTCDFSGTATRRRRVGALTSYITANDLDQRGSYSVLLRASMSDNTSIAKVWMAYGFGYESGGTGNEVALLGPTYRSGVVISGARTLSYWTLFDLGTAINPPMRTQNGAALDNFAITLDAERTSGSGSLYLDCLILMPRDDGFTHLRLPSAGDIGSTDHMSIYQYADDSVNGLSDVNGTTIWSPVTTTGTVNWGLPDNDEQPYIVIAAQAYIGGAVDSFRSIKAQTAAMTYTFIPRWRTLRGIGLGPAT